MPLTGNFARDFRELMSSYRRKGKIGNVRPKSKSHARKIAIAVAKDAKR